MQYFIMNIMMNGVSARVVHSYTTQSFIDVYGRRDPLICVKKQMIIVMILIIDTKEELKHGPSHTAVLRCMANLDWVILYNGAPGGLEV